LPALLKMGLLTRDLSREISGRVTQEGEMGTVKKKKKKWGSERKSPRTFQR